MSLAQADMYYYGASIWYYDGDGDGDEWILYGV